MTVISINENKSLHDKIVNIIGTESYLLSFTEDDSQNCGSAKYLYGEVSPVDLVGFKMAVRKVKPNTSNVFGEKTISIAEILGCKSFLLSVKVDDEGTEDSYVSISGMNSYMDVIFYQHVAETLSYTYMEVE
jgi:hypothetical protein